MMTMPRQSPPVDRMATRAAFDGELAQSCSWLKKITCAGALVACGAVCVGSAGAACAQCLAGIGAAGCIDCV
jgi:hypothetical protein